VGTIGIEESAMNENVRYANEDADNENENVRQEDARNI
jgi:hypothetical protein